MADQGFRPAPRVKNALDDAKMKLTAPAPTAAGKMASLVWGIMNNNPRITVYTQDPNEQDERTGYGKIVAKLDQPVFMAFMELIRTIANGPSDVKAKVENQNITWFGGKPSETPVVVNELWAGKDKDGAVWISINEANRPKIRFFISVPKFHCFYNGDGSPYSADQNSKIFAVAYANLVERMMTSLYVTGYVHPEPKKPFVPGQGGGQRNGGQGGGGGGYKPQQNQQQRPAPAAAGGITDDDFPY